VCAIALVVVLDPKIFGIDFEGFVIDMVVRKLSP